jgi:hypothetical protein
MVLAAVALGFTGVLRHRRRYGYTDNEISDCRPYFEGS